MNEMNLQYLKDNLKYTGFGDKLNESLEANVREGKPSFELQVNEKMHRGDIDANLHFRQSPSTGMYFFNSYEARVVKENGFERSQRFYLNNGKGVTLKEAYNLLDGRSVLKDMTNKEGVEYKAWLKLDFDNKKENGQYELRQFHQEKYGFDLKKELQKLNLSELPAERETQLMQSLHKGNLQAVNFELGGEKVLMFIEANPQFKTVNLYDPNGNQLTRFEKVQFMVLDNAAELKEPEMQINENGISENQKVSVEKQNSERVQEKNPAPASKKLKRRTKAVKKLLPQNESTNSKASKIG